MKRAAKFIPENLLLIGKVVRPHGIRGELKIESYSESPSTFSKGRRLYFYTREGELEEKELISVRPHKKFFLIKVKDINDRNKAEEYRNVKIYIEKSILEKEEGEYFWYELIGLDVYLVSGEYIGKIENILPTGSNDVYIVGKEEKEYLIPAIEDVVKEIDIERKKMIIEPLEGLLELAETREKDKKKEKKRR